MDNQIVVIFDKKTKEIIACIPIIGKNCIIRKDLDFKIYNGPEPVFTETESGIILNENAFMINMK